MGDTVDRLDTLLRTRRSVRGFLPAPVPAAVLQSAFAMAQLAPSNCNIQPWIVHVASGATAERLRILLYDAASSDRPVAPDVPATQAYPGSYRTRQIDAAKALFAAIDVARDDAAGRRAAFLRNHRFFDAPHVAFVFMPAWAGTREASDCGIYAQSLMLALAAHGVGSCAQGALSYYPQLIREALGIVDDPALLFGIAFGYEDPAHPANAARTDRAALAQTTTFHI